MYQSLAQTVYNEVKRRILSKEYSANEHISEKGIAVQLNVSKTPVRDALNQLTQEGYLTRYPSFGYIVKELTYQEVRDIFELRYVLESAAVRLIIHDATDEEIRSLYQYIGAPQRNVTEGFGVNTQFHSELGKLTKNAYLAEDILRLALSISRPSDYLDSVEANQSDDECHTKIVDALLARDVDAALGFLRQDVLKGEHREL